MVETVLIASALALAGLSTFVYRAEFETYSIFTVGVFRRINRKVVTGGEYDCIDDFCDRSTEIAEQRHWFKEFVVAGMVVMRFGGGEHHYCEKHASFEVRNQWDNPTRPLTQRVTSTFAGIIVELAGAWSHPDTDKDEFQKASDSIAHSMSDAFNLLPVILLIAMAAIILRLTGTVVGDSKQSDMTK